MSWVSLIPRKLRRAGFLASQDDETPCLLIGEAGSGKGGFARWIHEHGPRVGKPLLVIDRRSSWESQLLNSGTGSILFPEIESFDLEERRIFERCLRTKTVERVDEDLGLQLITLVPARIFATASETPAATWPLYPLFKDHVLRIPPVRERKTEFDDLAVSLLTEVAHALKKDHVKQFAPEALARLKTYTWPGNLREMRNALHYALLKTRSETIALGDLPELGGRQLNLSASREEFEKRLEIELGSPGLQTTRRDSSGAARAPDSELR